MTKIINLFGAPGSGKSTLAAGLFYIMKLQQLNVELVTEWIKEKLFEEAAYPFQDQLYTFAKQNKKIRQLVGKVDYIICDSPLIQGLVYSKEPDSFNNMVAEYFNSYDNLNILLKRTHAYHTEGRIQTEEESKEVGDLIQSTLDKYNVEYLEMPTKQAVINITNLIHLFNKEQ